MTPNTRSQALPRSLTPSLLPRVAAAFNNPPDAAGILQGVRRMRQGVPHTRIVLVPSPKNGGTIACEGRLEAALAQSLEIDPRVVAYRAQPFLMPGPRRRDVVCDLAVRDIEGLYTVIDVKPSGWLASPGVAERMRFAKAVLAESHIPHRIVTEIQLEREPARQIRSRLWMGVDASVTEYQRDHLLAFIRRGPITVEAVRAFGRTHSMAPYALEKLAVRNLVSFDINAPWSNQTLIGDRHENSFSHCTNWGSVLDVVVEL